MEINLTPTMERVLKMAAIEAERDKSHVGANHVLIGMLLEGSNNVALLLANAGFTAEDLRNGKIPSCCRSA